MRRVLLPLLLLPIVALGQFTHPVFDDWEGRHSISAFGRYQLASNTFSADMASELYTGGTLSREMRDDASGRLIASNRVGLDADFGLYFRSIPDSAKGIGYFIKVAERFHAHVNATDDLLSFGMFGNARFAGETAQLGPATLNYMNYKQYEIGLLKSWRKEKGTLRLGIGLSFLGANSGLSVSVEDGSSLYTHPDGERLEGTFNGTVRMSSLESSPYFAGNGLGFSGALHLSYVAPKFALRFEADDLGVISYGRKLTGLDLDTAFVFEGLDLNLFGEGDILTDNLDSIADRLARVRDGEPFTIAVPGSLRLEGAYILNEKGWRVYLGVQHRFAVGFFPLIYAGTSSPLGKGFFIDGRFGYGGFGTWNIGLELRKKFGQHFAIRAGTYNVEGFVMRGIGTGQSANVGLTGYF